MQTLIAPAQLLKCMADDLRLRTLLLILNEKELCVCELTAALEQSQPKISRHLAQLRNCGLLQDRRQGQWVFYRLNPALPEWVLTTLNAIHDGNQTLIATDSERLQQMGDRPERAAACC